MVRELRAAYRITDMEESERPRERLIEVGPQALSQAELLAILLRVGTQGENAVQLAQHLLSNFGGLDGLQRASVIEICKMHGVGLAKAAQIKAAIEIGNRLRNLKPDEKITIQKPGDAADLVRYEMSALLQESLRVINLDTRNQVVNIEQVYLGSLNTSMVRVAELFRSAIQRSAASIIVVHNHPSGDPTPSPEDINLTRIVVQAGKLLDIEVLDHLIIGRGKFISLKEKGLGFSQ